MSVSDEGNGSKALQRISQEDGLGRLIDLCEITNTTLSVGVNPTPSSCGLDISGTGFLTTYSYDLNDNLININQSGLNSRAFQFDSLSRLVSATNPESGTINYVYDEDGLFISKIAPAPNQSSASVTVTTTTTYDPLHRKRTETFLDGGTTTDPNTPSVTFNYDETSAFGDSLSHTTGRRSSEYVTGTSGPNNGKILNGSVLSYDTMGRIIDNSQCTILTCGTSLFSVTYPSPDYVGDVTSQTNGFGVTLTFSYNRALRPTQVSSSLSDPSHPSPLVSGVHFNSFGSPISASVNNAVLNETYGYDTRGRQAVIFKLTPRLLIHII